MDRKDLSPSFLRLPSRNYVNGNCKSIANSNSLLFFLCFVASMSTAQSQSPTPPTPPPTNPFGPAGHKFNSSMAIVMVVLVMAFFFMGFFSVYIRQCTERRTRGENWDWDGAVNFRRRSRRLMRGLEPSVIESFPMFLYSTVKGFKIGKDTLECAICLNEFEDDETLRMIPICSHVFHPDCIDAWLSSHSTCPVCRADLASNPVDKITCAAAAEVNESNSEREINNHVLETSHIDVVNQTTDIESPDENLINSKRSRSTGWRLTRLFPRSHSTGHSLVQPGENCERFTLRLPEDVRNQLMSSSLNRTKSCVALPRARSSRRGYKSRSLGRNYYNYERFDRSDQCGFTMTPPFFSRIGSSRSPKPMGLPKSIELPFDRLFIGGSGEENVVERSSNRLRSESQV